MLRIFLNLLIRNFRKNSYLNSFNILGVTFGLICFGLVLLYADHEFSFDNFHYDADNTYRIEGKTNSDFWLSNIDREYGKELNSGAYPQVKKYLQVTTLSNVFLSIENNRYAENNIYRVDPGSQFFEIFKFRFLEGDSGSALTDPFSIVMTQSTARKYFGGEPAVGKIISYDSTMLVVKGVIEDLPTNTHLNFDMIYSHPWNPDQHFHAFTYLQLQKGFDPALMEGLIKNMRDDLDEFHKLTIVKLIGIKDIYFESEAAFGNSGGGDKTQLFGFILAGVLILVIAIINYANLSVAFYTNKMFEAGIRKVMGESNRQFMITIFLESLLISLACLFLAIAGIEIMLPYFESFLGLQLQNKFISSLNYFSIALIFILFVNLITIIYPFLMLSTGNIGRMVKSKKMGNGKQGLKFWNSLIFVQFVLFFALGISAWFVNRQVSFVDHKDLGFSTSGVLKIRNAFFLNRVENFNLLKQRLLTYPQIESVTHGATMGDAMTPLTYKPEGHDQVYENLLSFGAGEDYFDVMNIPIIEGDFRKAMEAAESGQVISLVNEQFIKEYNWSKDPIGKSIILRPGTENELHRTVSAVFKDFNFFSLKEKIGPHIISMRKDPTNININVLIKMHPENFMKVQEIVNKEWNSLVPDRPVQYVLMDDEIRSLYNQERRISRITLLFSILALVLSLGGLMVFLVYITKLRSKEIALRQVLGATMMRIILVLNRRTFFVIMVAAIFGCTLSYFLITQWLANFANRVSLHPLVFLLTTMAGYGTVFAVIIGQSIRSAKTNPAVALRQEG